MGPALLIDRVALSANIELKTDPNWLHCAQKGGKVNYANAKESQFLNSHSMKEGIGKALDYYNE